MGRVRMLYVNYMYNQYTSHTHLSPCSLCTLKNSPFPVHIFYEYHLAGTMILCFFNIHGTLCWRTH